MAKTLKEILSEVPVPYSCTQEVYDNLITGIVIDSRKVQAGNLFVALQGLTTDGHRYIPEAIQRGAQAVVGTQSLHDISVPYVRVPNTRHALAYLAAAFHGFPARRLTVLGVTGTDGKTTTTNMIYQILLAAGFRTGIISTVNAVIGGEVIDTGFHVTTPEAPHVQDYLERMVKAGLTHVVVEATSHGLAQHRLTACEFDVAVVTNITHEHLDYHSSYQAYLEAKGRLFTELEKTSSKSHGNPRLAVLNRDDRSFDFLWNLTAGKKLTYGINNSNVDLGALHIDQQPESLNFDAIGNDFQTSVVCNMIGLHNVYNCLAALEATVLGLGVDAQAALAGIRNLHGIPGRMERIECGQPFVTIIDFAHTPNALRNALQTSRQLTGGRVICVFGSAGLRDRQKRRLMTEIAVGYADISIITAEDPRTEEVENILGEMAQAASEKGAIEGRKFLCIADRGEAIRRAVHLAGPGDVVISCGKGHEQSMCFGEVEYPWDDRIAMRAALSELLNVSGPPMPYLPTQN